MQVSIVKIGNSRGIRLTKTILEKYEFTNKAELILEDDYLVLKPIETVRNGWDEAFKVMNIENDDELLIDDVFEDDIWEEV